jgi:hypothetical protein
MASQDESEIAEEKGIPLNATTILALLTLLGGVLLATHRLSSDRPTTALSDANRPISEQKVNTRLWEDPWTEHTQPAGPGPLAG